jgi:hypothetical protein
MLLHGVEHFYPLLSHAGSDNDLVSLEVHVINLQHLNGSFVIRLTARSDAPGLFQRCARAQTLPRGLDVHVCTPA